MPQPVHNAIVTPHNDPHLCLKPQETLILKQGLEGIRETLEHDCDRAAKLVDYLCGQLNGGAT